MQRKCYKLQLAQKPSNLHPGRYLLILSSKLQKPFVNIMYQQQRHVMQVKTFFFSEKYFQKFALSILNFLLQLACIVAVTIVYQK